MKKSLLLLLLLVTAVAVAQQPAAPPAQAGPGAQPGIATAPSPKPQQKTIKDPAEYNAYISAIQATAPVQKAASLESFLQTYPNSVMKQDATELLLKTYDQLLSTDPQKYTQKVMETGQRLLQIDPNNLTALALLSYLDRALAQGGGANADQLLQQGSQYAERGLQQLAVQPKQEGYTDEQWNKLKQDFRLIFLGTIGHAAWQRKDYPTAQKNLQEVVAADPNNFTNVYLLALSYLEQSPFDQVGLFWIARTVALAPPQMQPALDTIQKYGRAKYARYHGSDEGWDQLVATAKTSPTVPPNFKVAPAPSPAEQAGMMVQKTKPEEMEFADWQFILTSGNAQAADQVWNAIKGKPVRMVVQVISVSGSVLQVAASSDDIQQNKADVELTVTTPPVPGRAPRAGTQITVQGTPSSYTPNPFLMRMSDGQIIPRAGSQPASGTRKRP
jgi:tetratricopeptide (TPR) repeat protein